VHHHTTCRRPSRRMLAERLPVQTPAAFKRWSCHQTTTRARRSSNKPTARETPARKHRPATGTRFPRDCMSHMEPCATQCTLLSRTAAIRAYRPRPGASAQHRAGSPRSVSAAPRRVAQERQRSTAPGRPGASAQHRAGSPSSVSGSTAPGPVRMLSGSPRQALSDLTILSDPASI